MDVRTSDFPSDDVLAGVDFQEKYERLAYENGNPPKCKWGEFVKGDTAVEKSLPQFAADAMKEAMPFLGRKLKGFDSPEAVMTAVESRSSSPIRIARDETGQSAIRGLYPCGEGAGYAGGILSAAADGMRCAEQICRSIREEGSL